MKTNDSIIEDNHGLLVTAEKFREKATELESAIKDNFTLSNHDRPLFFLGNQDGFTGDKGIISTIRKLRNCFSHENVDINDVNYVYVKQELIDSIDYLINKIEHPVTVGDKILSNLNPLYCADITFSLKDVLKEMKNKQYSNVPVFQGEHFFGIFSSNTIFSKFAYDRSLDDTGKISEYKDYLPIENHFDEYFDYVSSSLPLRKCISKFKNIKKGKRLALLLVTEGGRPSDDIKGVITVEDCL